MVAAGNTSLLSTSLVESTHSLSSNSSLHNVSVSSQQRSTDATTHETNVSSSNSGANIMSKLTSRRFISNFISLSFLYLIIKRFVSFSMNSPYDEIKDELQIYLFKIGTIRKIHSFSELNYSQLPLLIIHGTYFLNKTLYKHLTL